MKYTSTHKSMTPRAVLLKSGTKPINKPFSTARPTLKSAQPKMISFIKTTHSNVKRPFERKSAAKNKVWSPTVRPKILTVGLKVPTAKLAVAADKGNKGKAVKASARWIWKPKHMTGNISYLSEYEPFNEGYVSFGHRRGKITGKGSIKTDFKLVDDKHVLLRTPRQHNMYTIDLKNIAPYKNLTCLIAKASVDESMLWHRRLGKATYGFFKDMLADAKLPVTFWAEAVKTACYVQNKVLVIKPHNKTPYELFDERSPVIGFLRPFGCHIIILNTLDLLGKFDAKGDEGYFVGYSLSSKAFRVFNKRTKKIKENLHVDFIENKSIKKGTGTSSTNVSGIKEDVHQAVKEKESPLRFITLLNWFHEAQMAILNEAAKKDDAIPDNNSPQKEQQEVNRDKEVPKSSRNSNPTGSTKVSTNDSFASSSTVETKEPTVSSPIPTDSLSILLVTSSVPRIISKGGSSFLEPLSLGNSMSFENRLEDFFRDTSNAVSLNEVEADLGNMETAIQPLGFQDPKFLHRVHKVEKAMYGLHQAPRAWYDTFSKYLLDNGFQRGSIDQTLFVRKHKGEFLLVQVYVDDIIFGSPNPKLCREFEALMHDKFQMSAMCELNFFLGLQVLQKKDDIFLLQDKYVGDILKKFRYKNIRAAKTPMDRENPWGKDGTGKDVELYLYRSMIRSLMYLIVSIPDIMFAVCACARHQVTPKECHLHAVKRIFRYLKGNLKLGLW
nr:uncharacterized mitochondrial protein AtMg00810-like [Tanacetum cinerariifolium]